MDVKQWLNGTWRRFDLAGIGTAHLDALVLLEDVTGRDRAWLLAHQEHPLQPLEQARLNAYANRRMQHEPLAYIRGKTEFYGREFLINNSSLEPRPESETMIDAMKSLEVGSNPRIADIGSGCGALGITAVLEHPGSALVMTDIDYGCIRLSRLNASRLGLSDPFVLQGDLLTPLVPLRPLPQVILANLPYVPDEHTINDAAMHEPRRAIFGGPDGLDLYRRFFYQMGDFSVKPAYVITECLPPQHYELAKIAKSYGFVEIIEDDFIQVFES